MEKMLKSFFSLNGEFKTISTEEEFLEILRYSDAVRDLEYRPTKLSPARPGNRITKKRFTNVSFSKTDITGIEFKKCEFVDCLFIGTSFTDCEFHECVFKGCNPYKIKFRGTYIDPACFAGMLSPVDHSNIGVWLFQQLLRNSAECRQPSFSQSAQYYFHKWKRYQLNYEYKEGELSWFQYYRRWLPSLLYDHLAGYGLRLWPLARLTIALLMTCTIFNHFAWPVFQIHSSTIDNGNATFTKSLYYTVITVTTLGYGDLTPTSDFGMNAASLEALFGVVLLGLLANTIIKRVTK